MLFKYLVSITWTNRETVGSIYNRIHDKENGGVLWVSLVTKRYQPSLKEDFITQLCCMELNVGW